jgi:hypothetical protein
MAEVNWHELVYTDARKYFSDTLAKFQSMIPVLYDVESTDRAAEYDVSYSGVGNMRRFTGSAIKDTMAEEYKTTFEFPEYMNSIDIPRKTYDDAREKSVFNMTTEFALGAARTKEAHAAEIFNYAFSASDTYSSGDSTAGPDGKALCATDHPSTADGAYSGCNKGTDALSAKSVESTRILVKGITDGRGNKVYANMDMLLVPLGLEEIAWEIINSKGKVDTADNNRNFHQGRYKLAVWDELTDSTAWFGIDSDRMKRHLAWFNRVNLENYKKFDPDLQTLTFGVYGRWGAGFNGWRWVYGHQPA